MIKRVRLPPEAIRAEQQLFSPLHVDPVSLEWMARERARLEQSLPAGWAKTIVNLHDLTPVESKFLVGEEDEGVLSRVHLRGDNIRLYSTLKTHLPKLPLYTVKGIDMGKMAASGEEIVLEGTVGQVLDVRAREFNPSERNKLMLLWGLIGVIKGVRQPLLGLVREESGMVWSIEPKTKSIVEHITKLMVHGVFDETKQAELGRSLAGLYIKTASQSIKPRGACNEHNIRVKENGEPVFGPIVFMATQTPQESMDFMLDHTGRFSLYFMENSGLLPRQMQLSFLDTIKEAGMLNPQVLEGLRASPRAPTAFRTYRV